MLLVPSDKPFDYRQPPRLSLALAALLLFLFVWLMPTEQNQKVALHEQYRQNLLTIEWPLYPTHLLQHQQAETLDKLNEAHQDNNIAALTEQMGFDRKFVQQINEMGENYLEPEQLSTWKTARTEFDKQRDQLSSQVLGLDPQRIRPITYVTYSFLDNQSINVLISVLLLLIVGIATEWAMGSGALMGAWVLGSITTGLVYQLSHLHSVTPLIGSMGAINAILGMAFMNFRHQQSLYITGTQIALGGWLFLALFILITGINFINQQFEVSILISQMAAFISGFGVYGAYKRWFMQKKNEAIQQPIIEDTHTNDQSYRQELDNLLNQLTQFNFSLAEENARQLLESYPNDKRLQEILYHLCKFRSNALEFEELACTLFNQTSSATNNTTALRIYNDYKKRSKSFVALDANTCSQLAIRFANIHAFKEAEEVFKRGFDHKHQSPLLKKAALMLEKMFSSQQQEQKAKYYQNIAAKL